ncbi:DUF4136 domain-containing protein [Croceicoccus sp. BE223]|uniref:DUF4136 domain-containing protein n=1 Tax=Croceicoccus sp. BE223 TaxID=2817716 RepID=UPI002861AA71|nr:DUF4136 domain-containing protein [Croceicoccus sp. BE223]MDR7100961.1 hypothetical protein [Croceicoccus sp. BE223]
MPAKFSLKIAMVPALAATLALGACASPTGPVQVTHFNAPDKTALLGKGSIAVVVSPTMGPDAAGSLEMASYRAAVARELVRLGYAEAPAGQGSQVAEIRVRRGTVEAIREGGPVSVGVGGSTGSYGSGVGLGVGINLSGKPKDTVMTELGVVIRDRSDGRPLWEGRAEFGVKENSPLANTQLAAPRLAEALFSKFPGESGETFEVK